MSVTSSQIAKLAGVSRGTVDRALNNRGGISPETEKRVKEIAQSLGYLPNRAGRALAIRKKTPVFGISLCSLGNPFFQDLKRGMEDARQEFADFGLTLLLEEQKGYCPEDQLAALSRLASKGVKGIAVMPVNDRRIAAKIDTLTAQGIPFVTVNTDIRDTNRLAYIGCNYQKSGETAAGLANLLTGGRATLLIITGSIKNMGHNQRIYGFGRAIKNQMAGIKIADLVECNDDDDIAYQITLEKLNQYPEIDLIYLACAGAGGVVRAIAEKKQSVRLLCFDDTEDIKAGLRHGNITATICQNPYEQGYRAINTLFQYAINGIAPENEYIYTGCEIKIKQNLD